MAQDDESQIQYSETHNRLSLLLLQEESFWRQREKVFQLKEGDTILKFFHVMANQQKEHNNIVKLEDHTGVL